MVSRITVGSSHNVALATLYQVCLMPYGITLLCKDGKLALNSLCANFTGLEILLLRNKTKFSCRLTPPPRKRGRKACPLQTFGLRGLSFGSTQFATLVANKRVSLMVHTITLLCKDGKLALNSLCANFTGLEILLLRNKTKFSCRLTPPPRKRGRKACPWFASQTRVVAL